MVARFEASDNVAQESQVRDHHLEMWALVKSRDVEAIRRARRGLAPVGSS
jgi:hypothetical protein